VRHLSVGPYHAGAVTDSASLFMWGSGFTGALGVGNRADHVHPVEVLFPHSASADVWSQVACGYWHTLAVTEQGLTYSWGSGEAGQLGHGAKDCFDCPKQIEALSHIRMESIAAGMFNSAGITVEHVLFCWGKGENGQIGTGKSGPTALSVKLPTKVDIRADAGSKELSKVTSVVCSDTMTAVLTSAGECVMFGVGRVVNGDPHDILEPLSVCVPAFCALLPCADAHAHAGHYARPTCRARCLRQHIQVNRACGTRPSQPPLRLMLPAALPSAPAPRGLTFTKKPLSTNAIFAMRVRVRCVPLLVLLITFHSVFESKKGVHKCRKCLRHFCWCVLLPNKLSARCMSHCVTSGRLCGFKDRPLLRNGYTNPVRRPQPIPLQHNSIPCVNSQPPLAGAFVPGLPQAARRMV